MGNNKIIKIDDNTIGVIKTETKEIQSNFTIDYLLKQEKNILKQQKEDNEKREKELEEVRTYLDECRKLSMEVTPLPAYSLEDTEKTEQPA